jgi:cell division protein FtsW
MRDVNAWAGIDTTTIGLWLAVLLIGITMVGSASMEMSLASHGGAFDFALKHAVAVLGGMVLALGSLLVPLSAWQKYGRLLFLVGVLLLVLLLVPGLGREVNGATRWLDFRVFTVQPSELMKVFFIVFVARHLALTYKEIGSVQQLARLMVALAGTAAMLLLEPDFGSAVVLAATTFGVLLLAGARLGHLGVLAAVGGTAFALLIVFQPYRLARLGTFRDPWADEYGAGYQLTQALIAFGRGEWFGLGLGDSVQKLFYLPEAHNDFLFAVIAEETGMVGATIVIALLLAIAVRMLMLGRRAELRGHRFGAYVAYGIGCLVGTQTLINVGVNTGLLPTKGLTLPFVSYGSNSLIASGVLIGLVLRVHWELTWPPERTHRVR